MSSTLSTVSKRYRGSEFRRQREGLELKDRAFGQTRPSRRSFRATGALVAVMVAISSGPAAAQQPLLWGSLKPGPNAVGYRSLYRLDHTRQYDPEFVTDPTRPPALPT